jgi:hypothetical protein
MTTDSKCTHDLQSLDDTELADLRKQVRRDRPPMAWVDAVHRCSRCDQLEATVSWFGQVYHVPVDKAASGALSVRWPKRADAPGASTSMA